MSILPKLTAGVRALGGAVGVLCARADPGQVFRPHPAHRERPVEELEARFASRASKLGAVRGGPLPLSRKNMQTGE